MYKGKILLMDDKSITSFMAARYLRSLKYEVETAGDGFEAIELYKRALKTGLYYDAVILDLNITGSMGGEETIKKLLEIDPNIKAIAASAYFSDPVMAKLGEYGFKDILLKPYVYHELNETIQKVRKM